MRALPLCSSPDVSVVSTCRHRRSHTIQDADKFVKMVEVYVRGNSIKYVTIPEEVLDMVQEEDLSKESE